MIGLRSPSSGSASSTRGRDDERAFGRRLRRRGIAFTVLLALTMLLMALSSNPLVLDFQRGMGIAFRPIEGALEGAAGGVGSIAGSIGELDRLRGDNAQLRQDNARLDAENRRLAEIRRENELLTGLLQLRNGFEYQTVAAQVVARESSEFRRVVTLGKGTFDGIAVGDVVIAQGGTLAGRVVDAGSNFARVVLLTDTGSTVIGQLPSGATGQVIGQLGSPLTMEKIDSTERVEPGQAIVTAGIDLGGGVRSPFPKGLLIGQVIDVRRDANAVVQTAFLVPAAAVDRLEFVLVITSYRGGLSPLDSGPSPSAIPTP
jgi:rod shape-determining protein MreC